MGLKISQGNMYDWVTHMHSHLGGECPHKCEYCYVQRNRFGVSPRYKGEVRLIEHELNVVYGSGKTIFIEHMNDMFAQPIPQGWIREIFHHCNIYPDNNYVFQTKNPDRAFNYMNLFPNNFMIGTTIESNRPYPKLSDAPPPENRLRGISMFKKTFITIEPILDFDTDIFVKWITEIKPDFVNIGADSKNCSLPEPSAKKIKQLIYFLQKGNITIKKKRNLERFLP